MAGTPASPANPLLQADKEAQRAPKRDSKASPKAPQKAPQNATRTLIPYFLKTELSPAREPSPENPPASYGGPYGMSGVIFLPVLAREREARFKVEDCRSMFSIGRSCRCKLWSLVLHPQPSLGPQPMCCRTPTNFGQDPSHFSTGPRPISPTTPTNLLQPTDFLQDPSHSSRKLSRAGFSFRFRCPGGGHRPRTDQAPTACWARSFLCAGCGVRASASLPC